MPSEPINEKEIFNVARTIDSPQARAAYLHKVCGSHAVLLERVNALLQGHEMQESFLESPAAAFAETVTPAPLTEKPGAVIGPYKLLQQIGEGGFGVVYMAEQTEPVRRKVALKIIKPGMDTKEVIARFEAERQALALMDHPNIAKVLDAGATESGRPYFVMELVKGVPIIEYCDKCHLPASERLQLFVTICHAIQHAHQKGVIHRDLKPSNVMVTLHDGKPVPKVIDFGVSKALSQQLTERTLFTAYGQIVGTPAYMSPEQAEMSGLDIDTRSDVYSLGVLLYELLTGSTPFDAKRLRIAGYAEMQRIIREEDPPKPSTRLTTLGEESALVSANRGTDSKHLGQIVRGDLDWIVMKALNKERNRRYETANGFAADIERFLSDEPIEARPPSVAYKFKKLAKRNRAALFSAVLVAAALVLGMIGTSWQAIRVTHQRNRAVLAEQHALDEARRADEEMQKAKTQAAISQAVVDFLTNDLLGRADPHLEPDRDLTLSTVLNRASDKIEGRFDAQPEVEASICKTLGDTFLILGDYQAARKHLERAWELCRAQLGDEAPETLRVLTQYAWLEHDTGNYRRARSLLDQAVNTARRSCGTEHPVTLDAMSKLADVFRHLGDLNAAENLFGETIVAMQAVHGDEHRKTLECRNDLAIVYAAQDRLDEALELHSEVLEVCRRVLGSDDPRTIQSISNVAGILRRHGRHAEVEKLYLEAFEANSRVLGTTHPRTLGCLAGLANLADERGRHDEARSLREQALILRDRVLGPTHPYTVDTLNALAAAFTRRGQYVHAEQFYREEIKHWQERVTAGPESFDDRARLAMTHAHLARVHYLSDNLDDSDHHGLSAVDQFERLIEDAPDVFAYRIRLAELYRSWAWHHWSAGQMADATGCYERAADNYAAVPEQELRASDWGYFGQALYRAARYVEARVGLETSIELRGDEGPTYDSGPRWWYLVMTLHQLGETAQARTYYDQLVDQMRAGVGDTERQMSRLNEAAELLGVQVD